jgi:hypothetical protein
MKTIGFNLQDIYKDNDQIALEIYAAQKKAEELRIKEQLRKLGVE